MRMFDGRHTQPPAAQFAHQFFDQRGLAGTGMADNGKYIRHYKKPLQSIISYKKKLFHFGFI
jgi:hypothetical protein